MKHTSGVTGLQAVENLGGDLAAVDRFAATEPFSERLATNVLHREQHACVVFCDVEHAADVGVRHSAGEFGFAGESLHATFGVIDELDRDLNAYRQVANPIYGRVRSAPQKADNLVSSGDLITGIVGRWVVTIRRWSEAFG